MCRGRPATLSVKIFVVFSHLIIDAKKYALNIRQFGKEVKSFFLSIHHFLSKQFSCFFLVCHTEPIYTQEIKAFEEFKLLRDERNTWHLVHDLYKKRLAMTKGDVAMSDATDSSSSALTRPLLTHRDVWNRLCNTDHAFRETLVCAFSSSSSYSFSFILADSYLFVVCFIYIYIYILDCCGVVRKDQR